MEKDNFVESTLPIRALKSAVALQHSHENMGLLNSLTTEGSSVQYLGADGQYHDFPSMFFATAFVADYNQTQGNVQAFLDTSNNLYLVSKATFATKLNNRVIGSIEIEESPTAEGKQLDVSIAEVDTTDGEIYENPIHYVQVGLGLSVSFKDGIIAFDLVPNEAPFTGFMPKQTGVAQGIVGVFGSDGSIVSGGVQLSTLATASALSTHINDQNVHVNASLQEAWSAKQEALSEAQLVATNSGITAVKVQQYDGYATQKLNAGGHDVNKAVVTDALGNITTEDKFDPATKINTVPSAVQNRVAIFTSDGQIKDSGIILGDFSSTQTVREYIDSSVSQAISGSSYQGTFTLFGSRQQVESYVGAKNGDTSIVYVGSITNLGGLLRGDYNGTTWTFDNVSPMPTNGAWMEVDSLLTETPPVAGRVIVRMDGVHDPALDVRPQSNIVLDNVTIAYNSNGAISFKMRTLTSGKSVLNRASADSIAYEFTTDSNGIDTSKTIKDVIDNQATLFEPKFTKNTAFNKPFDTSSQSGTSTKVIGDKDTRLTNARPANGGNADTVDGKHANDFATAAQGAKADTAVQSAFSTIYVDSEAMSSGAFGDTIYVKSGSNISLIPNIAHGEITIKANIPSSLPANGGNADTVDGKHASDFATSAQGAKADSAYQKPTDGIPKTDLSASVQSSLGKADTAIQSLNGYATETYVDAKVAGIVNSAPEALDTLNELATALGNDPNFATTVATEIGKKVDKVDGKGLSSNDFTNAYKSKLDSIENGANKYVLPVAGSSLGGVKSGGDITVSNDGTVTVKENKKLIRSIDASVYTTPKEVFDYIKSIYKYDGVNEPESNIFSLNNGVFGGLIIYAPTYEGLYYIGDGDGLFYIGLLASTDTRSIYTAVESLTSFENIATKSYVHSEVTAQISGTIVQTTGSNVSAVMSQRAVTDALAGKVDKVEGKGLSQNDYTTAEKNKLSGIEAGANNYVLPVAGSGTIGGVMVSTDSAIYLGGDGKIDVKNNSHNHTIANVTNLQKTLDSKADKTDLQGLATETYVDSEVTAQINSAIGNINSLLDTINGEVI